MRLRHLTTAVAACGLMAVPLIGALPAAAQEDDPSRLQVRVYTQADGPNRGLHPTADAAAELTGEEAAGTHALGLSVTPLFAGGVTDIELALKVAGDGSPTLANVVCTPVKATVADGVHTVAIGELPSGDTQRCTAELSGLAQGDVVVTALATGTITEDGAEKQVEATGDWYATITSPVVSTSPAPPTGEPSASPSPTDDPDEVRNLGPGTDPTASPTPKPVRTAEPPKELTASPSPTESATAAPLPDKEGPKKGVVTGETLFETNPLALWGGLGAVGAGALALALNSRRRPAEVSSKE